MMVVRQRIPIKYELYRQQLDFVNCNDRFTAFIGGVGSGKTTAGVVKACWHIANVGGLGMIVAPTYTMLRDATLRTFKEIAKDFILNFHISELRAEMGNGAEVLFRSADNPERLRGPNLSWAYIDEAALCPAQTWDIVIGRLREGGRAGPCWITTTPRGRNWVYERRHQMTIFQARTQDNAYLDPEFVRSLESAYTGIFARQELEGEFVTFEGLVYEEFDRTTHVAERNGPWELVVAGLDEGYTNPAVILVVGFDNRGGAHVIEEFYERRVLQSEVVAECKRLWQQYQISAFYADPAAAGLIAEMRAEALPVYPAEHAVMPGIQVVKSYLAGRLTISPSCVNTIAEFESYCWKEGRQGLKDAPEKINDHAMDALRYALMSAPPLGVGHLSIQIVQHKRRPLFAPPLTTPEKDYSSIYVVSHNWREQTDSRPPWERD